MSCVLREVEVVENHRKMRRLTVVSLVTTALLLATGTASARILDSIKTTTNSIKTTTNRVELMKYKPVTFEQRLTSPEVNRKHPAYIHMLLDQSSSMGPDIGYGYGSRYRSTRNSSTKAELVARHTNKLLHSLIGRLYQFDEEDQTVRPYFDFSIRGYSDGGPNRSTERSWSLLDFLGDAPWHSISKIAEKARNGRVDQLGDKDPIWVNDGAYGGTPTREAIEESIPIVQSWATSHQESHPPIVAHLTDGEYTSGDPSDAMAMLRDITTNHGSTIMFNTHISDDHHDAVMFPERWDNDRQGKVLFENSSLVPSWWVEPLQKMGFNVTPKSRAFIYNGSIETFHNVIEMGTRAATPSLSQK